MRNGKVVFARVRLGREGRVVAELGQAKRREDRNDVCVVAKVEIEGLVQREGLEARVERRVDLRARVAQRVVLEARNDFLLISDADGAPGLGLPATVAGKEEVFCVCVGSLLE